MNRFRRLLGFGLPALLLAQCAPECAPEPPAPPVPTFGAGVKLVNQNIQPGSYYANSTGGCYWERLSGLGGSFDEIITNDFTSGPAQHLVYIAPTDVAFESDTECGTWTLYSGVTSRVDRITAGDWHVGQQMAPGRWATEGVTDGCYWERASGFAHTFDELIANSFGSGQRFVDIAPTDVMFSTTERCGSWIRIG